VYSDEQKFYITMYFALLRTYERGLSLLPLARQTELEELLVSVQNIIDFLLMIVSETDEDKKWNGVWSMSKNHEFYSRYAMLSNNASRTFPTDVTVELLKKKRLFFVSPEWFIRIHRFLGAREMLDMYMEWYHHEGGRETSTVHSLFIRSSIPASGGRHGYIHAKHLLRLTRGVEGMVEAPSHQYLSHLSRQKSHTLYDAVFLHMDHVSMDGKNWERLDKNMAPQSALMQQLLVTTPRSAVWKYVSTGLAMVDPSLAGVALAVTMLDPNHVNTHTPRQLLSNVFFMDKIFVYRGAGAGKEGFAGLLASQSLALEKLLHRCNHFLHYLKVIEAPLQFPPVQLEAMVTTEVVVPFVAAVMKNKKLNIAAATVRDIVISRCVETYVVHDLLVYRKLLSANSQEE
jgi:hypothetical protein